MTIKDVKDLFPCGHYYFHDRSGYRLPCPIYPYQKIDGFNLRCVGSIINIEIILKQGGNHVA